MLLAEARSDKFGFEATAGGIQRSESQDKRRRNKTCSRVQRWAQKTDRKVGQMHPTTCCVELKDEFCMIGRVHRVSYSVKKSVGQNGAGFEEDASV